MTAPRRTLSNVLSTAVLAALLAGCSGDAAESTASSSGAAAPAPQAAADGATGGGTDGGTGGDGAGGTAGGSSQAVAALARTQLTGSAVVRTAELSVRVDDVPAAADDAGRLVREAGGQLAAERTDGQGEAELTLRVPPERFDELLDALAGLGEQARRVVSTDQVGDQLVDLESRLSTQRASVARVQALLAEATDLGEVVQVEAELTRRTADLESLQARLSALQDQVDSSTVLLALSEPAAAGTGPTGFVDGLQAGRDALLATLAVLATVTGAALPFLPLAVVGWLVVRARRRRPAPPQAAAT